MRTSFWGLTPLTHGAQLRIRALVALGWSTRQVSHYSGIPHRQVVKLLTGQTLSVTGGMAGQVGAVYDALALNEPPTTTPAEAAKVARLTAYAASKGWRTPLGLDDEHLDEPDYDHSQIDPEYVAQCLKVPFDEAAVLRRLNGDRTAPITRADRFEIVRRGRRRGMSYSDLEVVCGLTKVERYIEELMAS